jgi:hypothetical protein
MSENNIRVYKTPNGPQVYLGNLRIHHWQGGLVSAIIGGLGLIFDNDKNRRSLYGGLLIGGSLVFLDDLPDFLKLVNELKK